MPGYKLNEDGILVDADGKPFEVGGEPVKVEGALTQAMFETKLTERLARQSKRVTELEALAKETPQLKQMLEEAKAELASTQQQAAQAKQAAEAEVANQIKTFATRAETAEQQLEQEKAARIREQVSTKLLSEAGNIFLNPAADVVPRLLQGHKREPQKGADGKETGEFVDLFKVPVKDKDGKIVEDYLPAADAVKAFASIESHQHYLTPANRGGSGGGSYGGGFAGMKRSAMTPQQISDFSAQHGPEAYLSLPE